jgi:Na+/melibiose symporter-like transporter
MESVKINYRSLKTQPEYLKLIAANVINRFGDSIDAIAIAWLMYEITGSASLMALILGLNYIPTILLQPITGAMVEHMSKKRVMIVFDIGRGLAVAAIAAFYVYGLLTPALLTAMMLLISTLEAFRSPAGSAVVPKLLDPKLYKVGSALNQTASRVSELVGLALAGGAVALLGSQGALLIDAGTFFLSALIIGFIRVREDIAKEILNLKTTVKSLLEGLSLIKSSRVIIVLLFIGALINFMFVPLNAYSVPFISDYLKGGPEVLSIINIVIVATLALGSMAAPKITRVSGKTQLIACGLIEGVALCLFAAGGYLASPVLRYSMVLFATALIGFTVGIVNVVYNAAFLRLIPLDYMARLSGISTAIIVCSLPLGSFLCSALAAILPVAVAIFASGILCVLVNLALTRVKSLEEL